MSEPDAQPVDAQPVDALTLARFTERVSLRSQVAEAIRGAVITGAMKPGVLYSAPALAARFGVSATPVREAMLDLVKEGQIESVRNKGFRVTELSEADLDQITEVRSMLEVPAVGRIAAACVGAIADRVEALRPAAREIVRHAVAGDLISYVEVDRSFHLGLLAEAGNPHLTAVVAQLRSASRLYGLTALAARGELEASAAEHEQLVDLVLARRGDDAARLMRRHIAHVRGTWAGHSETSERTRPAPISDVT